MPKKWYPHFDREAVEVPEVDDSVQRVTASAQDKLALLLQALCCGFYKGEDVLRNSLLRLKTFKSCGR